MDAMREGRVVDQRHAHSFTTAEGPEWLLGKIGYVVERPDIIAVMAARHSAAHHRQRQVLCRRGRGWQSVRRECGDRACLPLGICTLDCQIGQSECPLARKHVKPDWPRDIDDQVGALRGREHKLGQGAQFSQCHTVQGHDRAICTRDGQREDAVRGGIDHTKTHAITQLDRRGRKESTRIIAQIAAMGDGVHIGEPCCKTAVLVQNPVRDHHCNVVVNVGWHIVFDDQRSHHAPRDLFV